ncbi:glycoside hydrolase family 30 protein [Mangrovibacterium diazotrophicum]|uniref:Glucosylceramidase n=1 Tax=Mangrovibacterium diazotrophicum TaxID=1261403 RepID=A0A419W655_9BACT|nr:glycoside hydrolase family 30 protein [Mangrovibacterium diazotrophicum]RKD90937.1 glucosylceramidase [Mangrovibacterium diazotrophicum]
MKRKIFIFFAGAMMYCCASSSKKQQEKPAFNSNFAGEGRKVEIYTSAKDSYLRLTRTGEQNFSKAEQPLETGLSIFVNPAKTFQSVLGIGGAITDASAEVFAKLSDEKQQEFLDAYYGKEGIDYSLMRTHINSCDFSSASYTYIEEGDKDLKTFSIEHDQQFRIPMIKRAMAEAGEQMTLFVSPWSPPAFMKDNNNMLRGGKLLPEYYQAWANYYLKFIQEYEKAGIPIWGLTIQNEPMAVQTWESCVYTAADERDFLKNYLGPTMQKAGMGDKKIIVWDHNRDLIVDRANTILNDPEAAKYVWGVGFHWYETWRGGDAMWRNLQKVHEEFPHVNLMFTEGCNERFSADAYQRWSNGERYGESMINDFNNGAVGWTDWNILLDENGGPNHVGNFCFAPIHADTKTGELIYTPSYYFIGHFSKFVHPGAKRVSTATSYSSLLSTSFVDSEGKITTIVMNKSEHDEKFSLLVDGYEAVLEIPAHAIQTLIY